MSKEAVEMFVGGLVLDPTTQAPVVVLKDEAGTVHVPIWIGIAEATSIASALKDLSMARPLTHDLMYNIFNEVGVRVDRIVITELKDSTYYAELILVLGDKAIVMDSRPSDAIAIALRAAAPIFVSPQVLELARMSFSIVPPTEPSEGEVEGGEGESEEPGAPEEGEAAETSGAEGSKRDFKEIDKEKWKEILDKLDPEDFKFKV